MRLRTSYYSKLQEYRLRDLARKSGRTQASLLREALADLLDKYHARRTRAVDWPRRDRRQSAMSTRCGETVQVRSGARGRTRGDRGTSRCARR